MSKKASKHYNAYVKKYYVGFGGMTCACCTTMNPRKFKPLSRRIYRRVRKMELRKELN